MLASSQTPLEIMPPKSRSRKCSRAGAAPPSPLSQSKASAMRADPDPSFDFLAKVPSPVTLPPSQGSQPTCSGVATSSMLPPSLQVAAPPSVTASGDPYAFMAKVPSPVTLPSASQGQQSGTVTRSHVPTPPVPATWTASTAPPIPTQSAALPTPTAGGDSAFSFLTNIPSPVVLPHAQEGQGVNTVCIDISISFYAFHNL